MGEPALQLGPAAEAVGEAAAQQTTRLIVIEGGKGAATAAEAGAGRGLLARLGGATWGAGSAALAFFTVLLWPSTAHAPGLAPSRAGSDPKADKPSSLPVPQQNPKMCEECPEEKKCPPHDWYEADPGKSPEEGMAALQENIDHLSKSPSKAGPMRGYQFEKDAIDLNGKQRDIESTGRFYRCRRCGAEQEVDILFKDGQIAEAKSRSANKNRNAGSDQAEKYRELQAWLNNQNGTTFKPLGKLDKNLNDVNESSKIFEHRGFEVEQLHTAGKR